MKGVDSVWGDAAAAAEGEEDRVMLEDVVLDDGMIVGRVRMDEELAADDLTDALPSEVPEAVRAEATTFMELLMVHGVGAEAAKAKVAELYSPPRGHEGVAQGALYELGGGVDLRHGRRPGGPGVGFPAGR